MNENLNKILGELEEDLKKLQSAREQVEKVVDSNNNFAISANNLVENSQKLVESISISTKDAVVEFTNKLKESKDEIDDIFNQSVRKLKEASDRIEEAIKDVSILAKSSLEEQKHENLKVLNQLLETQNQLKKLISELLDLELPRTLKSIDLNLSKVKKDQNLIIIALGIVMILMLALKLIK